MSKTLTSNDPAAAVTLPAGSRLTVTTDAAGSAIVERYVGDALQTHNALSASQTHKSGEYFVDQRVVISCLTGTLTYQVDQTLGQLPGRATQTNDSAAAGDIGEFKTSTVAQASELALTTATAKSVTSLTLTGGEWEVWGVVDFDFAGATATDWAAGISSTADTLGGQDANTTGPLALSAHTDAYAVPTPRSVIKVAAGATVTAQLVARATFSVGTVAAFGTLNARRVR